MEEFETWWREEIDKCLTPPTPERMAKLAWEAVLKSKSGTSPFRVSVQEMRESNRTTFWVCLDRGDRPLDAKPWVDGRITPFKSENKEHADIEAERWTKFLAKSLNDGLSARKAEAKLFIDANVWDGEDRSGAIGDGVSFTPDRLQELIDELIEHMDK